MSKIVPYTQDILYGTKRSKGTMTTTKILQKYSTYEPVIKFEIRNEHNQLVASRSTTRYRKEEETVKSLSKACKGIWYIIIIKIPYPKKEKKPKEIYLPIFGLE